MKIDLINQFILVSCYNWIQSDLSENYLVIGDQMGSVYFYKVDLETKNYQVIRIFYNMFISQVIELSVFANTDIKGTFIK